MSDDHYRVQVCNRADEFSCQAGELLLQSMEKAGKQAIRVGCRKGGCGMCKIRIMKGDYQTLKMSRAHISEQEQQNGFVLACRTQVQGDLVVESDHFRLNSVLESDQAET